jgi:hypothetical protein
MKRVGILDENGAATDLGQRWRLDEKYEEVVGEILEGSYPEGLINIAPPGQADRSAVERWFTHAGLGEGTARNKAGTYLMIANDRPGESKVRAAPQKSERPVSDRKVARAETPRQPRVVREKPAERGHTGAAFPLNLNVQIHISADASTDQIEAIFAAMRKYLHDDAA